MIVCTMERGSAGQKQRRQSRDYGFYNILREINWQKQTQYHIYSLLSGVKFKYTFVPYCNTAQKALSYHLTGTQGKPSAE